MIRVEVIPLVNAPGQWLGALYRDGETHPFLVTFGKSEAQARESAEYWKAKESDDGRSHS